MTDPDLITRLRHGAKNPYSIGPVRCGDLLQEAANALAAVKAAAERALGAEMRVQTPVPLSSLLDGPDPAPVDLPRRVTLTDAAQEHLRTLPTPISESEPDPVVARFDPNLARRGGRFDPEPVDAYKERVRSYFGAAPATDIPFVIQRVHPVSETPLTTRKQEPAAPVLTMAQALADQGVFDMTAVTQAQIDAAILAVHRQAKPAPGTIEVAGGDGETIRALGLPEPAAKSPVRLLDSCSDCGSGGGYDGSCGACGGTGHVDAGEAT